MTTRFNQPSLRPAPALPPTLQPHAVLALAPATDRRRSAAMSAAVYAILAGGAFWFARAGAEVLKPKPIQGGQVVYIEQPLRPAVPVQPHMSSPSNPDVLTLVRPPMADPIADPTTPLSTADHSGEPPQPVAAEPPSTGTANIGAGPITISGDAVRALVQVSPAYPPLAMAAHLQGKVVVRMTIDERGVPTQVEAVSGPAAFHGPALRAAQQWRFQPATQDGRPVAATFLLTLNFVLR